MLLTLTLMQGIESQLCFAAAVQNPSSPQSQPMHNIKQIKHGSTSLMAGGWHPHTQTDGMSQSAIDQLKQSFSRQYPQFHNFEVSQVHTQVVAGLNYKIYMTAELSATSARYELEAIVHKNLQNILTTTYTGKPRLIAAGQAFANQNRDTPTSSEDSVGHPSATQATVLTNKEHGCSCERDIEKSKAAAGGALGTPQGSAESSDMVHVPKLALWLVGAAVTLMLAVIITLLYVVSTTRHRLACGPAVELNKVLGSTVTWVGEKEG